jgi:hypothetical protein
MNRAGSGLCWILPASARYGGSPVSGRYLPQHLAYQPWGWGDIDFFRLLRSNSSPGGVWNLGGYIYPHVKITESSCWELSDPEGGKTISSSTWNYVDWSSSCSPYEQNCRRNPCAGYTVRRCEASRGGCCRHKNFLLMVADPRQSVRKRLVCPSKPVRSNFPWSLPWCHPFSISVFLVQSQGPYCPTWIYLTFL